MKIITVILIIMICLFEGCGYNATGKLSQDLDSLHLIIRPCSPATVGGVCREGLEIDQLITLSPSHGVAGILIECSHRDTAGLSDVISNADIPVDIVIFESGSSRISSEQKGLSWEPRFQWRISPEECSFQAMVVLSNQTGQIWNARSVDIVLDDDHLAASSSGFLRIEQGYTIVPWWESPGRELSTRIIYGWPFPARWNALKPCIVTNAGPVISGIEIDGVITWPLRTGDTLWVPQQEEIFLDEIVKQDSSMLQCTLTIHNPGSELISIELVHPHLLPRGAVFLPGEGFVYSLDLQPGDVKRLDYSISYDMDDRN